MHSKAFFPSNDSEEINERILPTPKPFKNDLNYNFQSFDKKNLRESDQNPLNSFSSIAKMSNHNENEENFNLIPTNSLKTRNSDETMCENQFHLDDHINNIHLFDKEDSLNLGQVNFFPIYQKKHEMCKAKSNFKMRGPIVSEFTLSLDSETSNNLMKSKNEMHFSEHFNNFLNRKLIEKNDDLFDLNQKTYKSEDYQNNKLPSNKQSFQCSISSSINFELSNSLNNIFNSFNQSLNNRSIFSTGSDKENTPPLMQDQIKAYAIDNKNQNNLNFIVKCELAENGIESNGLETNEDIPLILTLQNDTYKTKYHNNFSLDLIVILSIKNIDSMSFFNRKNILQNFEYIFSCLNENDRFGLIKLGSSEKLKNINFLQKLSTLSKSMKKLMIQFLSYESFSNENIDIIKGLETAIETLNQRSYRNNYTSIVVISDMIFDKNVEKAIIIEKISNIQKKLKDYGFLRDTCFNISCVYCGTQSDEIFFLDHLSFINRGEIYYCKRLRALKKAFSIMMKKIKGISLFDITVFLGVQGRKMVRSIKSANYHIESEKDIEGSFIIKIPNIKFEEKKVILLFITLEKKEISKRNQLNVLKIQAIANKFTQATSLFNQTLNFEKLITNPLTISLYLNIPKNKLKHSVYVYKCLFQMKVSDHLMTLVKIITDEPAMKMKEITEFKNNYEKDYEIARIRNILEVKNKDKNSLMNYLSFLNKIILENYKLVEKEKNPNNISVQLLIMARNLKYIDDSFYNKKIKLANIKN